MPSNKSFNVLAEISYVTPVRMGKNLRNAILRKLSGFTLVELIVVITILAILATIGFLALSGYAQDAKDASVKANVRSVYSVISSESALTGNSPRYYVVHDPGASLLGAFVYVDGSPVALSGGDWNQSGTNYSAGNPDYAKLKVNGEKFRTSSIGNWFTETEAAYDSKYLIVGAFDWTSNVSASGRARQSSYFQVAGINPTTGIVSMSGNYPGAALSGSVAGLVKSPSSSLPLVDGAVSTGGPSKYPGCDTNDLTLSNGQTWSMCNVGAVNAWTGGITLTSCASSSSDCDSAYRNTIGSYFQWGRNDDVTVGTSSATLAATGTLAGGVGHSNFITTATSPYDWIASQNANLWGGATTSNTVGTYSGMTISDQTAMKGPCAAGYHVPTQYEWWLALSTINPAFTNAASWQNDTTLVSTLKLPLAGYRHVSTAVYVSQGSLGHYWSSSPSGTNGSHIYLSPTQVVPVTNSNHAY